LLLSLFLFFISINKKKRGNRRNSMTSPAVPLDGTSPALRLPRTTEVIGFDGLKMLELLRRDNPQCFEGDDLNSLISSIARKTGYQVNEHWLQLFGLCANCR
jgi:hypothetical protein